MRFSRAYRRCRRCLRKRNTQAHRSCLALGVFVCVCKSKCVVCVCVNARMCTRICTQGSQCQRVLHNNRFFPETIPIAIELLVHSGSLIRSPQWGRFQIQISICGLWRTARRPREVANVTRTISLRCVLALGRVPLSHRFSV